VACLYYDRNWWIGMVMSENDEEHDAKVKFTHPHSPARFLFWQSREDLCYVPYTTFCSALACLQLQVEDNTEFRKRVKKR